MSAMIRYVRLLRGPMQGSLVPLRALGACGTAVGLLLLRASQVLRVGGLRLRTTGIEGRRWKLRSSRRCVLRRTAPGTLMLHTWEGPFGRAARSWRPWGTQWRRRRRQALAHLLRGTGYL